MIALSFRVVKLSREPSYSDPGSADSANAPWTVLDCETQFGSLGGAWQVDAQNAKQRQLGGTVGTRSLRDASTDRFSL